MKALRFRTYFGEALGQVRADANLSRKALAEVLDVDPATVWRWEKGKTWPERPDEVVAIYEREGKGVSALDLWNDAINRANQANAKGKLAQFLAPNFPTVEKLGATKAGRAKKAVQKAKRSSGSPPRQ